MNNRPRIILDCDPGVDDAFAVVAAARWADLVGITTVAGNVSLACTTNNALRLRDLLGLEVPVHTGAEGPLKGTPVFADHVHGVDGLGGIDLPEPTSGPDSENAIEYLVESTRSEEGLHLVPIGPLTNIALALKADPSLAHRVASITLMGGSTQGLGNVTAGAEFNIYADPEAAEIVFQSDSPLTMIGLNLTHQVQVGAPEISFCRAVDSPVGAAMTHLLEFYADFYRNHLQAETGAMHDPCAVLAVTHPELFTFSPRAVNVETTGTHTRGMTQVDERGNGSDQTPNCSVAYQAESAAIIGLIKQAIAES